MKKDYTDEVHNGYRFIQYVENNKHGKAKWLCRCEECGKEKIVIASNVISGHSRCDCQRKFEDLTGKPFGDLVVLHLIGKNKLNKRVYKCRCKCGKEIDVVGEHLKSGHTQSCGCSRNKINIERGTRFNSWTVLSLLRTGGKLKCLCKCDCGTEKVVSYDYLKSGKSKSCGCLRPRIISTYQEDITNKKFEELTAISFSYSKNHKPYWLFRCSCGKEKIINKFSVASGKTTSCGCKNIAICGSKAENEIKDFIKTTHEVVEHDRTILNGKEIDIYIPELNLGIEYCGSVYHASIGGVYGDKPKTYHIDKFLQAKESGIHLVTVFDVDWETNQDKIKMYLKSLMTKQKKIFARKCTVSVINNDVACDFVDKYHLQGSNKATMKINYGLYYNDELLVVMSFGKLRMSKTEDGHFELHRYCVKDGYTVVGGANKLLKAFEKDYSPKYILSYSMNDYFIGDIYERLGFSNKGQCTPRYFWNLGGVELRRERCMLKNLRRDFPELLQEAYDNNASNKEDYVMLNLGACKVYRSGNTKWEKVYANI